MQENCLHFNTDAHFNSSSEIHTPKKSYFQAFLNFRYGISVLIGSRIQLGTKYNARTYEYYTLKVYPKGN